MFLCVRVRINTCERVQERESAREKEIEGEREREKKKRKSERERERERKRKREREKERARARTRERERERERESTVFRSSSGCHRNDSSLSELTPSPSILQTRTNTQKVIHPHIHPSARPPTHPHAQKPHSHYCPGVRNWLDNFLPRLYIIDKPF